MTDKNIQKETISYKNFVININKQMLICLILLK